MNIFSRMFSMMLLGLYAISAYAESDGFIALDTGYRWDRISNRVTLGGPTTPVKGSTQILKKINSYQFGARGQWCFCDCAFVRGAGHYGWVWDGDYNEGGFLGDAKGYTYDAKAAVGYYFCMTTGVWMAPVVGWSYDALNLRGTDINTAIDGVVYNLDDIKAHQRFNGPFIGFDVVYEPCECYYFTFGYEFHYCHWQGQRLIQGPEYGNPPFGSSTGFSNERHLNHVYGQVFKLDTSYELCNCWTVGLELKYQFFYGDFGKYKQTERPLLSQFSYANVDALWWRSFALTIHVGNAF
jgi:hypothetical protein